jgi:hypothetical protein
MSKKQVPEKVIGWNNELEGQIKRNAEAVKKAYNGLKSAYASQGVDFSLDIEAALEKAADSVKISGTRQVPAAKRLELLGVNSELIKAAHYALVRACDELGIQPESILESGDITEAARGELLKGCLIKAVGEDAVLLVTHLERAAGAVQEFCALMRGRNQNPPNAAAISQAFNGMLALNHIGECRIVPHMLAQYVRSEKQ